jgi:two-component sensor histidine kinase
LATNSYKYAFNENRQGEIRIDFAVKNGQLELKYQDNGPGLNADFGEPGTSGFGFKLIRILVDQIDGKIEYSKAHNTSIFIIRIHDKSLV